ncbi:MAG: signal peptidase I [Gammaproteobacteria bacterium]|nr:signal peptidase I [Gammaproteobacteria bacterium]
MDFALFLFVASLGTGLVWVWDKFIGAPQRARVAEGDGPAKESRIVEYSKAFFPVILLVFILRSFVVEPFRIPSGSMLPSLHVGDFILVSKFSYGLRLPIVNAKMFDTSSPSRGDVMVFRFPHDESINFIKRVVGLPGDHIVYENKKLYINGKAIAQSPVGDYAFQEGRKRNVVGHQLVESLDDEGHEILVDTAKPNSRMEFHVPEGHFFVMGDNRDYSNDSRYWGFVPETLIIGKAFFIWFSWDSASGGGVDWSRIAKVIN